MKAHHDNLIDKQPRPFRIPDIDRGVDGDHNPLRERGGATVLLHKLKHLRFDGLGTGSSVSVLRRGRPDRITLNGGDGGIDTVFTAVDIDGHEFGECADDVGAVDLTCGVHTPRLQDVAADARRVLQGDDMVVAENERLALGVDHATADRAG